MAGTGPDDATQRAHRRRAVRPAGTVGGDESALRSSFPAATNPAATELAATDPAVTDPAVPGHPANASRRDSASTRRAPDDEDVGWGTTVDDSNDERLTRERPPHW